MIERRVLLTGGIAAVLPLRRAWSQTDVIRIGCLTEMSGNLGDAAGLGSAACAQMAIDESGAAGHGIRVELIVRDHQNRPDIGANIAQQWFDQDGVDMIVDVPNSSVALAVATVARNKDKVYLNSGAGVASLTGAQCSPNTIHWTYDTWMLTHATVPPLTNGSADRWYFVAVDYSFGHSIVQEATSAVQARGGKVLGSVFYPFPGTTDYSSYLLGAQASGASIIAFGNAGDDLINSLKQAVEFGLKAGGAKIVAMLAFIQDIHAAGLSVAAGTVLPGAFYWDQNDRTRQFTQRLLKRPHGLYPGMGQAGTYSATLHYLKTVIAMGVSQAKVSGAATVAAMKTMPTDDDAFGPGVIRLDGRKLHAAYLYEVKQPAESKSEWDLLKVVAVTPANEAFRRLSQSDCPLLRG